MASLTLEFPNPRTLAETHALHESNLAAAAAAFGVSIGAREATLRIDGPDVPAAKALAFFTLLRDLRGQGVALRGADFQRLLRTAVQSREDELRRLLTSPRVLVTPRRKVIAKTLGQRAYLDAIEKHAVVLGIGPAGTGKTYLAMAAAVAALAKGQVQRIVLTRPAVEAGEALGFLPGDLRDKVLPYLRPLYDALYDLVERDDAGALVERGAIEIAPLAYMRGRTLSGAFVILDEAQNTTCEQMLMFLTRLGEDSRMIVTGDLTQVDLPRHRPSGLLEAVRVLEPVEGIAICRLDAGDVVRHPLVTRILEAYARARSIGTEM